MRKKPKTVQTITVSFAPGDLKQPKNIYVTVYIYSSLRKSSTPVCNSLGKLGASELYPRKRSFQIVQQGSQHSNVSERRKCFIPTCPKIQQPGATFSHRNHCQALC